MTGSTDANGFAQKSGIGGLRDLIDQATNFAVPVIDRRQSTAKVLHPLPPSLLPVASFDFDLAPVVLRPCIADIYERMQCAPDFIAVSVMAAAGSVIGRKVLIRPPLEDDWTVVPNQWALLIGRPGVMKSPAMEEALRPLKQLSATARKIFEDEKAKHSVSAAASKLRRDEHIRAAAKMMKKDPSADISYLLEDAAEEEPKLHRYIANDTTAESLGVLLQQNPNGLLLFRDELVTLLDALDQEDHVSQRGLYLSGWNGDSSYVFDRIGRGLDLAIEAVCLSLLGSTQPGRIGQYLRRAFQGGRGDDGLIQRFGLLVWPDVPKDWRHVDRRPDREARLAAQAVFDRLDRLDWRSVNAQRDRGAGGDEEGPAYLRLSVEAYDAFFRWRYDLEHRLRAGDLHPALESHLAKYRKLVPGLSLICHLVDGGVGPVSVEAVKRAVSWASYLETHARRAYGSVTAAEAETARLILKRIESGHLLNEFTARDVWRPGWSRLTDRVAVQAALHMLVEYDRLIERKLETGGRDKVLYSVPTYGVRH